jgi:hypothetical protein
MVRLKKPARKLSLRKRFLAQTSNEAVYVRSLEKRLFKLLTGLKQLRLSKQCKSHGISLAKAIAEEILRVITVPDVILQPDLHYEIQSSHLLNQNVGISLKPEKRTYIDFW